MKKFKLGVLFLLTTTSHLVMAQGSYPKSFKGYTDVSASIGLYTNTASNDVLNSGQLYSLNLGLFADNGIGFRGGIDYIDGLDDGIKIYSVPLHFAWRMIGEDTRTTMQRIGTATETYISDRNQTFFGALLTMLSIKAELTAGISPGYIDGNPYYVKTIDSYNGEYWDGLELKNRLYLTADAGLRLSLRIWRIMIYTEHQFHYNITDNFKRKTTLAYDDRKLIPSYFSITGGLCFIF